MNVQGALCFTKEEETPSFSDPWLENLKTLIRVSVKYAEHTRSQSGVHLCRWLNSRLSHVRWADSQRIVLSQASPPKARGSWRHIHVHVTLCLYDIIGDCSAGDSKTLVCLVSRAVLAIVEFGQGLLTRHSLMARPRHKRQVTIQIHPMSWI